MGHCIECQNNMEKSFRKTLFGLFGMASIIAGVASIAGCAEKSARINLEFPDDFNEKRVELIGFEDSTVIAGTSISEGRASFILSGDSLQLPLLAQIMVEGRVKGYYIIEPGTAVWCDTLSVAKGTELNDRFAGMLSELDAAEEAEDFEALANFAEQRYNENKDNVTGSFFGVEWLKWADPLKVDSLISEAPENFKHSKRAERYIKYARLRAKTSPGQKYSDFTGETSEGASVSLSDFVEPGKLTLVDFMASWCPYCIKDMPKLNKIREEWSDKGLRLVSVAVRDTPEATSEAVKRHGISWDVMYNTQKKPYEVYGFSGIPHYMLIGPDGKILARSGNLEDIKKTLAAEND